MMQTRILYHEKKKSRTPLILKDRLFDQLTACDYLSKKIRLHFLYIKNLFNKFKHCFNKFIPSSRVKECIIYSLLR